MTTLAKGAYCTKASILVIASPLVAGAHLMLSKKSTYSVRHLQVTYGIRTTSSIYVTYGLRASVSLEEQRPGVR